LIVLQHLDFLKFLKLEEVPIINKLKFSLQHLDLSQCPKLRKVL
jgi:hypothetical protein